ncbi:MAG: 2-oxo acid dehydrogenase subunit E2 [Candidatus Binataceae bacterium]|nr:2-oxo acid dehydrogenase subunit E2 [Candidatus Binataceae bacterium]
MAVEVTMPKFGLTMHEGTLQRFFKAAGENVALGEPLYEVETEKVLYVVEAPAAGTLAAWLHGEGAIVECGRAVALIAEAGEDAAALAATAPAVAAAPHAAAPDNHNASAHNASAANASGSDTPAGAPAAAGRRAISPVARKLAAELKVDLDRVTGTGPGGRITREDIEHAASGAGSTTGAPAAAIAAAPSASPAVSAAADSSSKPQMRTLAMRGMRRTIATRMHQSLRDTAQLTITTEADVTAATELRARLVREFDFTYTDLLIHAVARALVRHPRMNSRLAEEVILMLPEVNVGMAVALDEGLIVPVIAHADRRTLREIAAATKDLGARARTGQLKLGDVSGGTFTITNLGTFGVDAFTPILNTGETGILGVGRIVEKPAVHRGAIAPRSMITLSLTFDHRVIDGAPAAIFLQSVIDIFNYGER